MWRLQTITQGTRFVWLVFIWNFLKCKKILDSISRKSSKKKISNMWYTLTYLSDTSICIYILLFIRSVTDCLQKYLSSYKSSKKSKRSQAYYVLKKPVIDKPNKWCFFVKDPNFLYILCFKFKKNNKKRWYNWKVAILRTIEIWMAITWIVLSNMTLQHLSLRQNKLWNLYYLLLYLWSARILKILCLSFRNHSKPKWETIYKCMQPGDEHHSL